MEQKHILNLYNCSGDVIIKEGSAGTKMYFIQEGIVDIVMANGEVWSYLVNHLDNITRLRPL